MKLLTKSLPLLVIALLITSAPALFYPVSAQSIFKPSVPEFTVKMADHSYDVPLTTVNYSNPYTGQQETKTNGGYHVENITIDVTIKNQPFTPTTVDGNTTGLFYVIRWKGHYEDWLDYGDLNNVAYENAYPCITYAIQAATSEYTVNSYSLSSIGKIPQGGLVDFQVKAQIGFSFLYFGGHIQPIGTDYHWVEESDWSNTRTITIDKNMPAATPDVSSPSQSLFPSESKNTTPNQSSTQITIQLGIDWTPIVALALIGVITGLLLLTVILLLKRRVK